MAHPIRYETLVSAKTAEEAIEIAAEAIPAKKTVARSQADDVSAAEGPNSWHVTLWLVDR